MIKPLLSYAKTGLLPRLGRILFQPQVLLSIAIGASCFHWGPRYARICALSAERGVTTSSGFSSAGPACCAAVCFCSSTTPRNRYRAAGPLPACASRPLSTRLFSQRWRVRCGTPFRAAAISPLRAPLVLCRTKSTTAARSSAMSPTRRFATIRPLLIARLRVLRQLKHEITPFTRVSRHKRDAIWAYMARFSPAPSHRCLSVTSSSERISGWPGNAWCQTPPAQRHSRFSGSRDSGP